jgi:hypothetical protein
MALAKETSFILKANLFKLGPSCTNQGSMMPNECLNKAQMYEDTSSRVIR